MSEIIVFDGTRKRYAAQGPSLQPVVSTLRKGPARENQYTPVRIVNRFIMRQSTQAIAQDEGLSRTRVEEILREALLERSAA